MSGVAGGFGGGLLAWTVGDLGSFVVARIEVM